MNCTVCGKEFDKSERVAGISGRVMGDECTDIYYWCPTCQAYSFRMYRDVFCGPETQRDCGPLAKEEGDRRIALIGRCASPMNERCKCDAHKEYFGGWLDS